MSAADYRLMTEATGVRIAEALEDVTAMVGPKGDPGEVSEAELTAKLADKASAIVDTASGVIASFPDGMAAPATDITIGIEPVQSGSGDPSPTNVRPISGWTGAKVTRCGKNLLSLQNIDSHFTVEGNTVSKPASMYCLDLFTGTSGMSTVVPLDKINRLPRLKAGTYYLSTTFITGSSIIQIRRVNNDGSLSTATDIRDGSGSFTLQSETYITIRVYTNEAVVFSNLQLELGSTATDYEPYQGETYDITFPSEAGTVYGGTLDVTTGLLTVDRAKATVNGSESVTWTVVSETTRNFAYVNASSFLPGVNRTTNYIQQKDMYNIMTATHASSRAPNTAFINGEYLNLAFDISTVSTATELKAWLANNPLEVVYELATTQIYQLSPTDVALLVGVNNVWADTGDTTVAYRADTKLYIQKINTPSDDDMIADAQITSGKYFIIGGNLYKSTTTIPAGDTITPGTNCIPTNLADALNALNT